MTGAEPLYIQTLGEIKVFASGHELPMVPSRRTRALLGYLILSRVPQRRERLCEILWDRPEDPRGSLRWSLSKLRSLLNWNGPVGLLADRERVSIDPSNVVVDIQQVSRLVDDPDATAEALSSAWAACRNGLLENCDLPNLSYYSAWLTREREVMVRVRARLAKRLAIMASMTPEESIRWADAWLDDCPLDSDAAQHAISARQRDGRMADARALHAALQVRFRDACCSPPTWPTEPSSPESGVCPEPVSMDEVDRSLRVSQRVRFVRAKDRARLAWSSVGADDSPPLVKAANWLSHLELDWHAPIWCPLFRDLARHRRFIRYDSRGCGLSDWDVSEISFESFVTDLEMVVDAAGLEKFPLLGISQGAAVSIEYASRHPERVSHLILFGGYPVGWRHVASPQEIREREAVMVLTEAGWGRDDPTYRHLFTGTFLPAATSEELHWFDEFQRLTTSPANAVRFLEAFSRIDVRARLPELRIPTLVLHSRGDRRIPLSTGKDLATTIPGAEFLSLDSPNHLLLGREPVAAQFLAAVREFLSR